MHRWITQAVVVLMVFGLVGCGGEEDEIRTAEPVPVPEPTTQELYSQMKGTIQVFWNPLSGAGGLGGDQATQDAVNSLQQVKSQNAGKVNLPAAVDRLKKDISNLIIQGQEQNRYKVVQAGIEAYDRLSPPPNKYRKLKEKTRIILARPKVEVTGFIEMDGELFCFIRTTDKATKETQTFSRVRAGDTFMPGMLRLSRIVGDQSGVEFEYLPLNEFFVVGGPSEVTPTPPPRPQQNNQPNNRQNNRPNNRPNNSSRPPGR
jgi:hypothetical protein